MSYQLLIVESPGKVKKLSAILGNAWKVVPTVGHVRDLPIGSLGIDTRANFAHTYEIPDGKTGTVEQLMAAMKDADAIYVATDPDREGEAIAWHVLELAKQRRKISADQPVHRVTFDAITAAAVQQAIHAPRRLDRHLVEAQLARRSVDRLIGYPVSSIASQFFGEGCSAGRVQSVALRLVVEREHAIQNFQPETRWTLAIELQSHDGATITARLTRVKGKPMRHFDHEELVTGMAQRLQELAITYRVAEVHRKRQRQSPHAPFITSTLQQTAAQSLGFSPEKTMGLAQKLYEEGLITYIRTDAPTVSPEAQQAARHYIGQQYGAHYVPADAPRYAAAGHAQEAHECIRPTDVTAPYARTTALPGGAKRLYELIWQRFIASQMAPAIDDVQTIWIEAVKDQAVLPLRFEARAKTQVFDGYRTLWSDPQDMDHENTTEEASQLYALQQHETLQLQDVLIASHQTKTPPRFHEASLIRMMDKRGIGRPSTYAETVARLKYKGYVVLQNRRLVPTKRGLEVWAYLADRFAHIFDYNYTSRLERHLDQIAGGDSTRNQVLNQFWADLKPLLSSAATEAEDQIAARNAENQVGEACPACGEALMYRHSKKGKFIGCSGYPACDYTRSLKSKVVQIRLKKTGS